MRIAYLSSSFIPSKSANSIHVMKMAQALAALGHEVTLISPAKRDSSQEHAADPFIYYGVTNSFEIHRETWSSFKGKGYWYGWCAALAARHRGAELAYGRNLAACFFASKLGLPVLYESHTPVGDEGSFQRLLFNRLIRSRGFRGLVVITRALESYYEDYWPELKGKIIVAPDGADLLDESIEAIMLPGNEARLQVGYAGSLYRGKGMEVIVPLAQSCPWANFHIIGGDMKEFDSWFTTNEQPPNLLYHGRKAPGEVCRYLIAMDVLLLPNQLQVDARGGRKDIGRWTSPLKAFEYMAAGRAILCSDVPVLREVIQDGRNAIMCPPDRIDEWARALERLAADAGLRGRLGAAARWDLEECHSWSLRAAGICNSLETKF